MSIYIFNLNVIFQSENTFNWNTFSEFSQWSSNIYIKLLSNAIIKIVYFGDSEKKEGVYF